MSVAGLEDQQALTALLGGGTVLALWAAFRALHMARLLEDTPTSRIRSAAQGYVELAGRGTPLDGTGNLAPLTRWPCVWWSYRIERRVSSGRRKGWRVAQRGVSEQPFVLADDTGRCVVDPRGAQVLAAETTTWYGDTPWPGAAPGAAGFRFVGERAYRYTESRIYAHERLHAIGAFHSVGAIGTRSADEEVRELLLDWKADRAAMTARFDADRDGEVGLAEWQAAHEAARREVANRRADRVVEPALHTLARPDDGRPFVLGAFTERDIVKRYRRRAIAAFVTAVATGVSLAYLLQHPA